MNNNQLQDLENRVKKMESDFNSLSQEYYKNNFRSRQDFNKYSNFTQSLKIPNVTTFPNCQVGELCESAGKLYICSAVNTWTLVGTQS